jgi:hypothetical protein
MLKHLAVQARDRVAEHWNTLYFNLF